MSAFLSTIPIPMLEEAQHHEIPRNVVEWRIMRFASEEYDHDDEELELYHSLFTAATGGWLASRIGGNSESAGQ